MNVSKTARRGTGARGKGLATRERILEAALKLFARRGFEATGIREIASEAGVTTATLYHYAANKEDILLELMQRGMGRLLAAVEGISPLLESPEQRLVALVRLHVMTHGTHRLSAVVNDSELRALGDDHRAVVVSRRDEYESYWRRAIGEGVSQGVFHAEDHRMAALALLEMCTGVVHWYSPGGRLSISEISLRFADMALGLVEAERSGMRLRSGDVKLPEVVEDRLAGVLES